MCCHLLKLSFASVLACESKCPEHGYSGIFFPNVNKSTKLHDFAYSLHVRSLSVHLWLQCFMMYSFNLCVNIKYNYCLVWGTFALEQTNTFAFGKIFGLLRSFWKWNNQTGGNFWLTPFFVIRREFCCMDSAGKSRITVLSDGVLKFLEFLKSFSKK